LCLFIRTSDPFKEILLDWTNSVPEAVEVFKVSVVLLDFAFPVAYAIFGAGLALLAGVAGLNRRLAYSLAVGFGVAGLDWMKMRCTSGSFTRPTTPLRSRTLTSQEVWCLLPHAQP